MFHEKLIRTPKINPMLEMIRKQVDYDDDQDVFDELFRKLKID